MGVNSSKLLKRTYHDECARHFDRERTLTLKKGIYDPAIYDPALLSFIKCEQFDLFYKLLYTK